MSSIVERLKNSIRGVFDGLGIVVKEIHLEHPEVPAHGDFSTNAALHYAKEAGKSPRELADILAEKLRAAGIMAVEKIEVAGPGFVNFRLSREFFSDAVKEILKEGNNYGKSATRAGKKIMIEYTDPNPFKEFHIGHLMSNAIGESLARLLEFSGAEVKRANYQGDVGLHVAKALLGKQERPELSWGEAYAYGAQNYEDYKKEVNELNEKIYQLCWGFSNERDLSEIYNKGRYETTLAFEKIYEKLGMESKGPFGGRKDSVVNQHFDFYFKESESGAIGKVIVQQNTPKVFEESDGAIVFHGEKYDPALHTRVFITSQGLPTYEAKELGLFKSKQGKFEPLYLSIVITGNEIRDYFKVVLKAAEQIDEIKQLAEKTTHITHGMLRLPSGKMSSRTGDVITAEWLIEEAKKRIMEKMRDTEMPDKEKIVEEVAIGAIKYSILKHTIGSDIIFDFDASLSFEGDSGPYLQYTHARARSVLEKATSDKRPARTTEVVQSGGQETRVVRQEDAETAVEQLLYQFPEVVSRADTERAPQLVTTYLTKLAQTFNNFYAHERIVDSPYRLALAEATATVLKNGLWILGIAAPERM
ncbi:MAG: arginine--tRNA ligase [Parcubacteria group bacterium]|nr:arginine--tRNA ligase [Candidatus Liptonbacteria bacterium]MBI3019838.1 arginine--tRNA ligase [Parcubacteria group bacterium]MBI3075164.1 arginine--tRNA ligase [Parcubacteria group bacterium]